jgi:hypothetical protein
MHLACFTAYTNTYKWREVNLNFTFINIERKIKKCYCNLVQSTKIFTIILRLRVYKTRLFFPPPCLSYNCIHWVGRRSNSLREVNKLSIVDVGLCLPAELYMQKNKKYCNKSSYLSNSCNRLLFYKFSYRVISFRLLLIYSFLIHIPVAAVICLDVRETRTDPNVLTKGDAFNYFHIYINNLLMCFPYHVIVVNVRKFIVLFVWGLMYVHCIIPTSAAIYIFPMPPHVPYGLRGLPSRLWPKCNRLLRLGRPWGAVMLSRWGGWWYMNMKYQEGPTKLPRPRPPWKSSPSSRNPHSRTGNRTRDLTISSQKLWSLYHEAGLSSYTIYCISVSIRYSKPHTFHKNVRRNLCPSFISFLF